MLQIFTSSYSISPLSFVFVMILWHTLLFCCNYKLHKSCVKIICILFFYQLQSYHNSCYIIKYMYLSILFFYVILNWIVSKTIKASCYYFNDYLLCALIQKHYQPSHLLLHLLPRFYVVEIMFISNNKVIIWLTGKSNSTLLPK